MRIGELARRTEIPAKTLRFYESEGLLPEPERQRNGYRDYGSDFEGRLRFIRRAQVAGLTLAQVRDVLDLHDQGLPPCTRVTDLLAERLATVRAQLAELAALETTLEALLDRARHDQPDQPADVCWILEGNG